MSLLTNKLVWETLISAIEGNIVDNLAKANEICDRLRAPQMSIIS